MRAALSIYATFVAFGLITLFMLGLDVKHDGEVWLPGTGVITCEVPQ
jgi:hypothetical protein